MTYPEERIPVLAILIDAERFRWYEVIYYDISRWMSYEDLQPLRDIAVEAWVLADECFGGNGK